MKLPVFSLILFLFITISLYSCKSASDEVPLEDVHIHWDLKRLDRSMVEMANAIREDATKNSMELYSTHLISHKNLILNWMYGGNALVATDSLIAADFMDFLSAELAQQLMDSVSHAFGEEFDFRALLENPLKRYAWYFPEEKIPAIRTYVSGYMQSGQQSIDDHFYSPPVYAIGLHYYMGPSFSWYPPDIPVFLRIRFQKACIPIFMMRELCQKKLPSLGPLNNPQLLTRMIHAGKTFYFLDKMLPDTPDSLKIFYTHDQWDYASFFEGRIYGDLLPHLYSTDFVKHQQYLDDKPFTTHLSRESAPRLGEYCGWMIVRSYMKENPDVSLSELLAEEDYDKIFRESKYRPKVE